MPKISGALTVKLASGNSVGAGDTAVPFRPSAEGIIWECFFLYGHQNDGAVVQAWHWIDPATPAGTEISQMTATATFKSAIFGANTEQAVSTPVAMPIIITYTSYPVFHFTASAAAKTGTVRALVIEHFGTEAI